MTREEMIDEAVRRIDHRCLGYILRMVQCTPGFTDTSRLRRFNEIWMDDDTAIEIRAEFRRLLEEQMGCYKCGMIHERWMTCPVFE